MKTGSKITLVLAVLGAMLALQKRRQAPDDFAGQTVLITGGSRGLGLILAREFGREGCRVVICARDELELDEARRELAQQGVEVLALSCDVSDQDQIQQVVDVATRRCGQVDILINNAGVIQVGPQRALTLQDFEQAHAVMFWGVLYATLAVLPQMQERHSGRIVNITSIGGKVSIPHLLPYTCAKYAAVGLSEGLRSELKRRGITVTTIVPGLMRTGSYLNALFKGNEADEFTWFALGASLPFVSMDAERAARQIVEATKRGEAERILSIPASLLARFHGLFPGVTQDLLGLVSVVLPSAAGIDPEPVRGAVAWERLPARRRQVLDILTALGRRAAQRFQ